MQMVDVLKTEGKFSQKETKMVTYRLNASIDPELLMVEEERVLPPVHILLALELAVPSPHRVVEPFGLVNVTVLR